MRRRGRIGDEKEEGRGERRQGGGNRDDGVEEERIFIIL